MGMGKFHLLLGGLLDHPNRAVRWSGWFILGMIWTSVIMMIWRLPMIGMALMVFIGGMVILAIWQSPKVTEWRFMRAYKK